MDISKLGKTLKIQRDLLMKELLNIFPSSDVFYVLNPNLPKLELSNQEQVFVVGIYNKNLYYCVESLKNNFITPTTIQTEDINQLDFFPLSDLTLAELTHIMECVFLNYS